MAPSTTTCDGDVYLHNLASFIKSHERQLANALLAYKKQQPKVPKQKGSNGSEEQQQQKAQLQAKAQLQQQLNSKPVRLSLTLHHLYYLLERFYQDLEFLNVSSIGPMNIRLDNIHNDDTSLNYVSFLSDFHHQNKRMSSDAQSIHSMSSVKSVMSSVSALWSSMSLSNHNGHNTGSSNNTRDMLINDLKYLYSAFTKLPCLRLAPDSRAKLIEGHEEYPFDTAVPLKCFKNLSVLEIYDLNLKEIYGWNIISEQIKFLVLKKTNINDPVEILIELVEEDLNMRGNNNGMQYYEEDESSSSTTTTTGPTSSPINPIAPTLPQHHHSYSTSTSSASLSSHNLLDQHQHQHQQHQHQHQLNNHIYQYPTKKSYPYYNKHLSTNSIHQLSGSVPENSNSNINNNNYPYHYAPHHTLHRISPTLGHATLARQQPQQQQQQHAFNEDNMNTNRPRKNTSNSATAVMIQPSQNSSTNLSVTTTSSPPLPYSNSRRSNTLYQYQPSTSPPSSNHFLSAITTTAPTSTSTSTLSSSARRINRSNSVASDFSERYRQTQSQSPTPPPYELLHQNNAKNRWRQLKHLSFTQNNITTITDYSFEPLQSLTSLDLSHNKLSTIPLALLHLKNLKSLNLSYNKLESTQGFKRNELTKLSVLNLKNNHLKDLSSLEFLKNVEKLDLRYNKLEIVNIKPLLMGVKPLKLQLLFLQNNNMKNYRLELFNLFNGIDYQNNLKIDGSRPGIFESRLLLDSKNAELKLNKFFISQITNSISTMALSSAALASASASANASANASIQQHDSRDLIAAGSATGSPIVPEFSHPVVSSSSLPSPAAAAAAAATVPKTVPPPTTSGAAAEYILLPPYKPFVKPVLTAKTSQDTLTTSSVPMQVNNSIHSSPSLIIKNNNYDYFIKDPSPGIKTLPTSPEATTTSFFQIPVANNTTTANNNITNSTPISNPDSPRTIASASHKINRLSNDLSNNNNSSSIVATSNNSQELLGQKFATPLPPIITTSTVNNKGNSNSSSQRTSIISTTMAGAITNVNADNSISSLGKENSRGGYHDELQKTDLQDQQPQVLQQQQQPPSLTSAI